jgi:putative DNA methylase
VRLRDRAELTDGRDPGSGLTAWELVQRLVDVLETEGEQAAAALLNRAGAAGEAARELAYRLYATCERRRWAAEARAYNALVVAWPELARLAAGAPA